MATTYTQTALLKMKEKLRNANINYTASLTAIMVMLIKMAILDLQLLYIKISFFCRYLKKGHTVKEALNVLKETNDILK